MASAAAAPADPQPGDLTGTTALTRATRTSSPAPRAKPNTSDNTASGSTASSINRPQDSAGVSSETGKAEGRAYDWFLDLVFSRQFWDLFSVQLALTVAMVQCCMFIPILRDNLLNLAKLHSAWLELAITLLPLIASWLFLDFGMRQSYPVVVTQFALCLFMVANSLQVSYICIVYAELGYASFSMPFSELEIRTLGATPVPFLQVIGAIGLCTAMLDELDKIEGVDRRTKVYGMMAPFILPWLAQGLMYGCVCVVTFNAYITREKKLTLRLPFTRGVCLLIAFYICSMF